MTHRGGWTRRRFLRTAFWSAVLGGGAGGVAGICRYLRAPAPSRVTRVSPELLPPVGDPPRLVPTGRFYVVQLAPGEPLESERFQPPVSTPGGFLVLTVRYWWTPCHRRVVEWVPSFRLFGLTGAFMEPCRHSAFNRAGLPVYGPAARPMDTLRASFDTDGSLLVDPGAIRPGGADNPLRTVRP